MRGGEDLLEPLAAVSLPIPARPFLKWAGGKGQLLDIFEKFYPVQLRKGHIKKYIEPFVGSGAVLFKRLTKLQDRKCLHI